MKKKTVDSDQAKLLLEIKALKERVLQLERAVKIMGETYLGLYLSEQASLRQAKAWK